MTTKVVSYKSYQREVDSVSVKELETRDKDGIKHTWSGYIDEHYQANFTWEFDWEELKKQGFDRLVGHLIVNSDNGHWNPHRVDIDWTEPNQSISTSLGRVQFSELHYDVTFEYELTAHHTEKPPLEKVFLELPKPKKSSYDEKFVASDKTDVVLVVEGKKLNVNKTFLAFHSDYFSTLFSAKFKEGQMKEIEIKEVSYEDFELLCSSFYPNPQFPNDSTSEKLLEMASRFQVSSVIGIVEYHLLNNSKIAYEKMLWLADEYIMPKLLEKCISQMNSLEMAKKLEKSPEFEKLSDRTSSLIFRQLLKSL
ncbi:hypothetical protein B9Z55_007778 [Caenorhabditis nigoni]|nr:hypothetical protein B9Z55_007778 [Caenorhabditis nigoni]